MVRRYSPAVAKLGVPKTVGAARAAWALDPHWTIYTPEDLAQMEIEMQTLERDILQVDESYGRDVVNLTIARGYVKKLLENAKVVKYLAAKHADVLTEFQRIHETATLEG